jgi:hypothetical protein
MRSVHAGTWTCPLCRGDIIDLPKESEPTDQDIDEEFLNEELPYSATLRLANDNYRKLRASVDSMWVTILYTSTVIKYGGSPSYLTRKGVNGV